MEKQIIVIPRIVLKWSEWHAWNDLKKDARKKDGIKIPNRRSGVYEARYKNAQKRLTIGKATNLRHRVRQCLVKGKSPHSSGEKIRAKEDVADIEVRWAVTERRATVEEHLHIDHKKKFGKNPKYVDYT